MRLGNSPINWSNEDLRDLGGEIPVEQCLREMAQAGYAGTEYGYKLPTDPADCSALLSPHRLALASSWHSFTVVDDGLEAALARLDTTVRFLAQVGAGHVNLCDTSRTVHTTMEAPLSTRPIFTDAEWQRLANGLDAAGELCLPYGVKPGYHFHMGTGVQTAAETDRLMAMTNPGRVWLCPDSGHAAFAGDDPAAIFAAHADRIGHVHFKDVRGEVLERARAEDWSFLKATVEGAFTVPGDGTIDFVPLVVSLRSAGYADWVIVEAEQYLPDTDPLTYATQCRAYLGGLLELT